MKENEINMAVIMNEEIAKDKRESAQSSDAKMTEGALQIGKQLADVLLGNTVKNSILIKDDKPMIQ